MYVIYIMHLYKIRYASIIVSTGEVRTISYRFLTVLLYYQSSIKRAINMSDVKIRGRSTAEDNRKRFRSVYVTYITAGDRHAYNILHKLYYTQLAEKNCSQLELSEAIIIST